MLMMRLGNDASGADATALSGDIRAIYSQAARSLHGCT